MTSVSPALGRLLAALRRHPEGITLGRLAAEASLNAGYVRRLLDAAYRAGLVGRRMMPREDAIFYAMPAPPAAENGCGQDVGSALQRLLAALEAHPEGITAGRLAREAGVGARYAHTVLAGAYTAGLIGMGISSAGHRLFIPFHYAYRDDGLQEWNEA
jgi:hypothetical protein